MNTILKIKGEEVDSNCWGDWGRKHPDNTFGTDMVHTSLPKKLIYFFFSHTKIGKINKKSFKQSWKDSQKVRVY